MRWTAIEPNRRTALALMAAGAGLPLLGMPTAARSSYAMRYLSSRRRPDGVNVAAIVSNDGRIVGEVPFDGRGHGGAVSPDGRACAIFARRPGTVSLVLDRRNGSVLNVIKAQKGRHFFGHGFYSRDGRRLFATENDYANARGVLGIYDVADGYRRIGEFDTFGVGPHQCLLSSDGRTAIVANGGIETHPDYPRQKLNLPTMDPNIVRIDIATGDCLDRQALSADLHQLSLRHMAEAPDGAIWIGGQYQGAVEDDVPILAVLRRSARLTVVDVLAGDGLRARRYIGSVAANSETGQIAVTAPRGGLAHILDGRTGQCLQRLEIADVCGVAPLGRGFLFSDGNGGLWHDETPLIGLAGYAWDNHLTALPTT